MRPEPDDPRSRPFRRSPSYALSVLRASATCLAALLLAASPWVVSWRSACSPRPDEQLRAASVAGDPTSMARAMAMGARVDGRNRSGMSPLADAVAEGNAVSVRWLTEQGADVNGTLPTGVTPLFLALWKPEVVAVLIEAGANVDARLPNGRTPLMAACGMGDEDAALPTAELLLAAGADVNAACDRGSRALAEAADCGHARLARRLLSAGADANAADVDGRTALDVATDGRHESVVAALRERAGAGTRRAALPRVSPRHTTRDLEIDTSNSTPRSLRRGRSIAMSSPARPRGLSRTWITAPTASGRGASGRAAPGG